MSEFQIHTTASAPEAARPILEGMKKDFGFLPNLLGGLAEAPAALEGYTTLSGIFNKSSLTPVERQVVLITVSVENICTYCVAAHSGAAEMAGIDEADLEALRTGDTLPDARLEALRAFTQKMVAARGFADDADLNAFLGTGYTRQNALEVVLAISLKTLSNYANHLIDTPLDDAFQPKAWTPSKSEAA